MWQRGENVKTVAKKRLKENILAFLDDTVSRMAPRKFIKGSTNTARQMKEMDISADSALNTGLETRSERTKTSKIVKLQGRTHSDLFNQEKLILNGIDLVVKLHCHKPELFDQCGYRSSL